jgi:hypothetical protein
MSCCYYNKLYVGGRVNVKQKEDPWQVISMVALPGVSDLDPAIFP